MSTTMPTRIPLLDLDRDHWSDIRAGMIDDLEKFPNDFDPDDIPAEGFSSPAETADMLCDLYDYAVTGADGEPIRISSEAVTRLCRMGLAAIIFATLKDG